MDILAEMLLSINANMEKQDEKDQQKVCQHQKHMFMPPVSEFQGKELIC